MGEVFLQLCPGDVVLRRDVDKRAQISARRASFFFDLRSVGSGTDGAGASGRHEQSLPRKKLRISKTLLRRSRRRFHRLLIPRIERDLQFDLHHLAVGDARLPLSRSPSADLPRVDSAKSCELFERFACFL